MAEEEKCDVPHEDACNWRDNEYFDGIRGDMNRWQPTGIPIKLYVGGIPSGITTQGLKNIFQVAGNPLHIFVHHKLWGFVEFATVQEAEKAVTLLHKTEPYNLKVQFANRERETNLEVTDNDSTKSTSVKKLSIEDFQRTTGLGRGKLLMIKNQYNVKLPQELDYKGDRRFFNTDLKYLPSLQMYHGTDDERFLPVIASFGRGCIDTRLCQNMITKPGKRQHFSSKTTMDKLAEISVCKVCKTASVAKCSRCNIVFYCSQVCQAEDWPKHKVKCGSVNGHEEVITNKNNCDDEKLEESNVVMGCGNYSGTVFEMLKAGTNGCFTVTSLPVTKGGSVKGIVSIDSFKDLDAVLNINDQLGPSVKAKPGDAVLTLDNTVDPPRACRAVVLSRGEPTYRVHLVDYGKVDSVDKVFVLPARLKKVVHLGGEMSIAEELEPELIKIESVLKFKVTADRNSTGELPCILIVNDQALGNVLLHPYHPPPVLNADKLTSGEEVVISSYIRPSCVYLRSTHKEKQKKFLAMSNEVAGCCFDSQPLLSYPPVGTVLAARFSKDKSFYRAVVTNISQQDITVVFIDFGNHDIVHLTDLRNIPQSLKEIPCFAVRVILQGVLDCFNASSVKFLNALMCREMKLLLKYENKTDDEVELTVGSGVSVNKDLIDLLTPWKTIEKKRMYGEHEFDRKEIIYHKLGTGMKEVVVTVVDEEEFLSQGYFYVTDHNSNFAAVIHVEVNPILNEYNNYVGHSAYLPMKDELCLAKFEGEWFRAMCLDDTDIDITSVLFIDFGNVEVVKLSDIRQIDRGFPSIPATAVICALHDFEQLKQTTDIKQMLSFLTPDSIVQLEVTKIEDGLHFVKIPYD